MRVLVLADSASSAAGYAALAGALGREAWSAVGAASAMLLAQEAGPDAALIALCLDTPALRVVVRRVRAVTAERLPVVLALPESSWWLRASPGADLAPVVAVPRGGLTARTLERALARLGLGRAGEAAPPLQLDGTRRLLTGPDGGARLTPAEGALMAALLDGGGVVAVSRLVEAVCGDTTTDRARVVALRTHLHELRRQVRLVGAQYALLNEPGRGYRLAMS